MAKEPDLIPTWGYASDGTSEIFNLLPGEALPEGYEDSPAAFANDYDQKVFNRGVTAASTGKDRSVPPAYRAKPTEVSWLAGFDSFRAPEAQ